MSTFTVSNIWLDHSGGTKFYQVYLFERVDDQGHPTAIVTASHYGSYKAASTQPRVPARPIKGGQVKLKNGDHLADLVDAKKTRGYAVLTTGRSVAGLQLNRLDEAAFRRSVVEQFGASKAHEIMKELGMMGEPADLHPGTSSDHDAALAREEARPEIWGSW